MATNIDISSNIGMTMVVLYQVLYVAILIGVFILIVYLIRLIHLLIMKLKHDMSKNS